MDIQDIDMKKAIIALVAVAGSLITLGSLFHEYRDLPEKVEGNAVAIRQNQRVISETNDKLDAVLCLLIQDQVAEPGQDLNPLLCLNAGASISSFLPSRPGG